MPNVVLFPYLMLEGRAQVGEWELVPRRELKPGDAALAATHQAALDHLALYGLQRTNDRCGCFARPAAGRVGDDFDRDALRPLRLAVLAGLLDQNPSLDVEDPNQPLSVATSENAIVYAHPITDEGYVIVNFGFMAQTCVPLQAQWRTSAHLVALRMARSRGESWWGSCPSSFPDQPRAELGGVRLGGRFRARMGCGVG